MCTLPGVLSETVTVTVRMTQQVDPPVAWAILRIMYNTNDYIARACSKLPLGIREEAQAQLTELLTPKGDAEKAVEAGYAYLWSDLASLDVIVAGAYDALKGNFTAASFKVLMAVWAKHCRMRVKLSQDESYVLCLVKDGVNTLKSLEAVATSIDPSQLRPCLSSLLAKKDAAGRKVLDYNQVTDAYSTPF